MALDLAFDSIGDGPPLVILHGLFGSRTNWRSIARAMSATHRVISVDLRNHGGSPWADTMGDPEMADDVRELMAGRVLGGGSDSPPRLAPAERRDVGSAP